MLAGAVIKRIVLGFFFTFIWVEKGVLIFQTS